MSAVERLDAIAARAEAAPDAPWYVNDDGSVWADHSGGERASSSGLTGPFPIWAHGAAEFIAASRTDVPALVAALMAVLKPEMVEGPDWIGEMRTWDIEGADPGNAAYLDYLNRVLSAAYPDGFRWGPILLAIVLDRHMRATEDAAAITTALGGRP